MDTSPKVFCEPPGSVRIGARCADAQGTSWRLWPVRRSLDQRPPARGTLRSSRPGGRFLLERVVLSRARRGLPPGRRATTANQWVTGCSMQARASSPRSTEGPRWPKRARCPRSLGSITCLVGPWRSVAGFLSAVSPAADSGGMDPKIEAYPPGTAFGAVGGRTPQNRAAPRIPPGGGPPAPPRRSGR